MSNRKISNVLLSMMVIILMSACTHLSTPSADSTPTTGFVSISFAKGEGVKSLAPTVDMVAFKFDVIFTRMGATTVQLKDLPGTTTVSSPVELITGTWSVTVNAYNAANAIIGTGTSDIDILAGKTITPVITVSILPGNGNLSLSSTWAGISLLSPSISGTGLPLI